MIVRCTQRFDIDLAGIPSEDLEALRQAVHDELVHRGHDNGPGLVHGDVGPFVQQSPRHPSLDDELVQVMFRERTGGRSGLIPAIKRWREQESMSRRDCGLRLGKDYCEQLAVERGLAEWEFDRYKCRRLKWK